VPKLTKKRRVATKRTSSTKRTASKRRLPAASSRPLSNDEAAYVETLIQTGQAKPLTEKGKLPAGATHEIVETRQGQVTVVRRRFSMA